MGVLSPKTQGPSKSSLIKRVALKCTLACLSCGPMLISHKSTMRAEREIHEQRGCHVYVVVFVSGSK